MLELKEVLDECEIKNFTSLFFDVQKIVRAQSICSEFSLERTEKVWAYHKSDKGLFSRIDIVFTNKAIHTCDKMISYDKLPGFIVSPTELDTVCLLFNSEGEIELSHKNLLNTFAENQQMDLVEFVRTIQAVVIRNSDKKKKQYSTVIEWFYKEASIDVRSEPYYLCAIDYLGRSDNRAIAIKYKSVFMDFDLDAIASMDLDENAQIMIKAYLKEYEETFKDPYSTIDLKTVKIRLRNLGGFPAYIGDYDDLSRYYSSLAQEAKAYYHTRKYPYAEITSTVEKFGVLFDNENRKKDYAKFCFMYRNVQMGKLLKSIKDKKKVKVKSLIPCSDGMGFNILHYAIIMGDDEMVSECLNNYRKIDGYSDKYATYSYNPFDYVIIAGFLGNTELAEQINETIGPVGVLLRTKKSLERYIAIREGLHSIAQSYSNDMGSSIREARRNTPKYDYAKQVKYKDTQDEIEEFDKKLNNDSEFIDKLKEDLEDVERQIRYERESFYPNLREKLSSFSRESDPYISAIRNFYEKPDDLYKALNASPDDVKVVWGDGFFYYNIKDIFEFYWDEQKYSNNKESAQNDKDYAGDSSNRTDQSNQETGGKRGRKHSRPYGNSWFSPEAHKDYRKLRIEYRELAKKFHPDNNTGCEDIFKEINSEREIIMERLR